MRMTIESEQRNPTAMAPTLRVHALSTGRLNPSARFRVRQYIEPLKALGVRVTERPSPVPLWSAGPPEGWSDRVWARRAFRAMFTARSAMGRLPGIMEATRASLIWLQKELVPGLVSFEPLLHRPYIFDIDDAVWMQPPWGPFATATIARRARVVLAGNEFLAKWLAPHARRIEILPTPVDMREFFPGPESSRAGDRLSVGWIGSHSGLSALEETQGPLAEFLARYPAAELVVVCNKKPKFDLIAPDRWRFVLWSPTGGPDEVRKMDIGIMPLRDTPHSPRQMRPQDAAVHGLRYSCGGESTGL